MEEVGRAAFQKPWSCHSTTLDTLAPHPAPSPPRPAAHPAPPPTPHPTPQLPAHLRLPPASLSLLPACAAVGAASADACWSAGRRGRLLAAPESPRLSLGSRLLPELAPALDMWAAAGGRSPVGAAAALGEGGQAEARLAAAPRSCHRMRGLAPACRGCSGVAALNPRGAPHRWCVPTPAPALSSKTRRGRGAAPWSRTRSSRQPLRPRAGAAGAAAGAPSSATWAAPGSGADKAGGEAHGKPARPAAAPDSSALMAGVGTAAAAAVAAAPGPAAAGSSTPGAASSLPCCLPDRASSLRKDCPASPSATCSSAAAVAPGAPAASHACVPWAGASGVATDAADSRPAPGCLSDAVCTATWSAAVPARRVVAVPCSSGRPSVAAGCAEP